MTDIAGTGNIKSDIDLTASFSKYACVTSTGTVGFTQNMPDKLQSDVMIDGLSGKAQIPKAVVESGAELPNCGSKPMSVSTNFPARR